MGHADWYCEVGMAAGMWCLVPGEDPSMQARLSFPVHDMGGGEASSMVWALYVKLKEIIRKQLFRFVAVQVALGAVAYTDG